MSLTDAQVAELNQQMNDELDIYIPANIEDDRERYQYEQLFGYLRRLVYQYNKLSNTEAHHIFIDFYNANKEDKNLALVKLENTCIKEDKNVELFGEMNEELEQDKAMAIYDALDPADRPAFLFALEHGYPPEPGEDLGKYEQIIRESEQEMNKILNELQQTQEEEYYTALSPEEVAAKYFKGSGAYDPASRNSGFRVDQIEQKSNNQLSQLSSDETSNTAYLDSSNTNNQITPRP